MKKIKPLHLLVIGFIIVLIGGLSKILKSDISQFILILGIIIELVSGVFYIVSRNKNDA